MRSIIIYLNLWKTEKQFFYPKYSAFSFNKNKSSVGYYGARLSKGFNEPDLHGTAMFIWGILIASKALSIDCELGLRTPIL